MTGLTYRSENIEMICAVFLDIRAGISSPSEVPTTLSILMNRLSKVDQVLTRSTNASLTSLLHLSSGEVTDYSSTVQPLPPSLQPAKPMRNKVKQK